MATDPTRTTVLRNRLVSEFRRRYRNIESLVNTFLSSIYRENLSEAEAISRFRSWLDEQYTLNFWDGDPSPDPQSTWFYVPFIIDAYTRGIRKANVEARRAGVSPPEILTLPERSIIASRGHQDALRAIYEQVYAELKGINGVVSQQAIRELTDALNRQLSRDDIRIQVIDRIRAIGEHRTELLARTIIVQTHAEAMLNRLDDYGIEFVSGESELVYTTAGDNRVCPICEPFEGRVYTIQEARGVIPQHPNCRCGWRVHME